MDARASGVPEPIHRGLAHSRSGALGRLEKSLIRSGAAIALEHLVDYSRGLSSNVSEGVRLISFLRKTKRNTVVPTISRNSSMLLE